MKIKSVKFILSILISAVLAAIVLFRVYFNYIKLENLYFYFFILSLLGLILVLFLNRLNLKKTSTLLLLGLAVLASISFYFYLGALLDQHAVEEKGEIVIVGPLKPLADSIITADYNGDLAEALLDHPADVLFETQDTSSYELLIIGLVSVLLLLFFLIPFLLLKYIGSEKVEAKKSSTEAITTSTSPSSAVVSKVEKSKIYFSYAWRHPENATDLQKKIVDELYNALEQEQFKVVRDKVDLHFGNSIEEFMKEIGKGSLILVFISKRYFESHFCMFELSEILRNSNFEKDTFISRIVPIPVEHIDFTLPAVLEEYFNFWKKELETWSVFIKEKSDQIGPPQVERFNKVKTINQNLGAMMDWIADTNQSDLQLLSSDDFKTVKATILQRLNVKHSKK